MSGFCLVALLEGEYLQSLPVLKQRTHIGRPLEHLTLAIKQPSHDARKRVARGFDTLEAMLSRCEFDVEFSRLLRLELLSAKTAMRRDDEQCRDLSCLKSCGSEGCGVS